MAALALILCYFQYHFDNTFCLVTKAEVSAHEISHNCYHTFPYMYTVYEVQTVQVTPLRRNLASSP